MAAINFSASDIGSPAAQVAQKKPLLSAGATLGVWVVLWSSPHTAPVMLLEEMELLPQGQAGDDSGVRQSPELKTGSRMGHC